MLLCGACSVAAARTAPPKGPRILPSCPGQSEQRGTAELVPCSRVTAAAAQKEARSVSSRGGERERPTRRGGAEAAGRGPGGRGAGPEGTALPSHPPSPRLLANGRVRVSPLPASVVSGGTIAFRA